MAERTGATNEAAEALCGLAGASFESGDVVEGFALLDRARHVAQARTDSDVGIRSELYVAAWEVDSLLGVGRLSEAVHVADDALDRARRRGVEHGVMRALLLAHGAEASVELGHIDRAAELTDEIRDHRPRCRTIGSCTSFGHRWRSVRMPLTAGSLARTLCVN